jgi:hypothetical protein
MDSNYNMDYIYSMESTSSSLSNLSYSDTDTLLKETYSMYLKDPSFETINFHEYVRQQHQYITRKKINDFLKTIPTNAPLADK